MKHELIYTWAELKAAKDRIAEIAVVTDAISDNHERESRREEYNRLWKERHELEERVDEMERHTIPEVGMPCTVIYYSDRSSAVVIAVRGNKKKEIDVKQCGTYSGTKTFTYRSNGHWVQKGTKSRDWGTLLGIGYQEDYYDMSF
jgi:hypothetical protein